MKKVIDFCTLDNLPPRIPFTLAETVQHDGKHKLIFYDSKNDWKESCSYALPDQYGELYPGCNWNISLNFLLLSIELNSCP